MLHPVHRGHLPAVLGQVLEEDFLDALLAVGQGPLRGRIGDAQRIAEAVLDLRQVARGVEVLDLAVGKLHHEVGAGNDPFAQIAAVPRIADDLERRGVARLVGVAGVQGGIEDVLGGVGSQVDPEAGVVLRGGVRNQAAQRQVQPRPAFAVFWGSAWV